MYRGTGDFQSPWLYPYLLNASADEASECLEPTFVRVIKHVAGPFEDGSVRKQVSDGDLFMDALFSSKAIESGILCEDSQMEWDNCDLLLKRYYVRYEMPAVNQNCVGQMVLVVNECELMPSNHGFSPRQGFSHRENPTFCMTRPELQKKLQSHLLHLQQAAEGSSSSAVESNLAVSLLMGQMSEDGTAHTHSQATDGLVQVMPFREPPDLDNFLISDEDQLRLDDIEEWLSNFVPVDETPPSTSHLDAVFQSHSSSQAHNPSPQSLPTIRPKILCDASVQVTFCLHDTTTRPATAEVGVEVGDSLMFNTQQPIAEPIRVDDSEEGYRMVVVPISSNLPVAVPIYGDVPVAVPTSAYGPVAVPTFCCDPVVVPSSSNLPVAVPSSFNLSIAVPTSGYAPVVVPCSALLPPILVPCVQDFPLREEMWSSGSSLRLSCDEEPNDLQRGHDPNLEMLGQKLVSSDSSANMMLEDESPVSIHTSKITSPPHSRVAIIPRPSARNIHLEESTVDPITMSVLRCSEPERLDPVIATLTDFRFIQSTQIDYLSSQHCPIEPDFPLSPVMQSEEFQCSTQSFRPVHLETTSVGGDEIVCCVENLPRVGNVSPQGTASGAHENVSIGERVPRGGTISSDGDVLRDGNTPNIGSVLNFETVVESGDTAASGYGLRGGTVASAQSISCLANVHGAGESRIAGQSHPRSTDGNVCSSGVISPRGRDVSNNEIAASNDRIIPSSGSVDWSTLPDVISFGSADRAIEAEKCRNGDGATSLNAFEHVSETDIREGNISPRRIVGRVWISPPRQRGGGDGDREAGGSKAGEKLGEEKAGESNASKEFDETDDVRNDDEKLMNIRRASKGEDVRRKDTTMNDGSVVGTEAARRELNISPRHILTSDIRQLIPASLSVPLPLSVTRKTIPANVSVSNHTATAIMSVANQDSSARVSVSKQTTSASVSASNHFASASLSVSHQMCTATSTSCPFPQLSTANSGLRINPSTLTSLFQACANICLPVSVAGSTSAAGVSAGCSNNLLPDNQSKNRTKSPSQSSTVARVGGEVPCMSALGSTRTYHCATSKPMERENEESETDSFDEELIKSAESSKLRAELEPSESSSTNILVLDPVKESTRMLQVTGVSTRKEVTKKIDNVMMKDKKEKIGEKKNKKLSIGGKGSRHSPSQRRDPMALFATRVSRKLRDNRKRKLYNVDQMLERISSGNQTDSEGSDTRFGSLGKRHTTVDRAPGEKKFKGDSDGKSRKTDTRGKAGVAIEQSSVSGNLGNTNTVVNRTSGLRILPREIADELNHLSREQTKKSKIGSTGITNATGNELGKNVTLKHAQCDSSALKPIDHVAMHLVKNRVVATVGVNHVQIVPLETTVSLAEGDRESHRKTDGNCRFSEERSWRVAADKLNQEKSRNRRSSVDMFTGLTDKPNDEDMHEDMTHLLQVTCNVSEGAASRNTSDTRSCDKDIITLTDTNTSGNSRDLSRNSLHPKRSAVKQTVSNRVTARDTTSRDRETVGNSGSSVRDGLSLKSIESQTSVVERLSLPTPKNSLPSHQPPRQSSVPHGSGDQSTPFNSGQPSSPKFNRDRIKMLLGRDKMTSDEAKAFSCSDLPENLKRWTFSYFKNLS